MWQTAKRFLREADNFGSPILQNMNGATTIGTVCGGILSIIANIFFIWFLLAQIFVWVYEPDYNMDSSARYLPREQGEEDMFTVPIHKLMPTFTIVDNIFEPQDQWIYNDKSRWDFQYVQVKNDERIVFDAVPCDEMIRKMQHLSMAQKIAYIDEFPRHQAAENVLCPEMESFDILGGITGMNYLELVITATSKAIREDSLKKAAVLMSDISTVFEPESFLESGFQTPVTLKEKVILPDKNKTVWQLNFVAMDTITWFDNSYIDLSALGNMGFQ